MTADKTNLVNDITKVESEVERIPLFPNARKDVTADIKHEPQIVNGHIAKGIATIEEINTQINNGELPVERKRYSRERPDTSAPSEGLKDVPFRAKDLLGIHTRVGAGDEGRNVKVEASAEADTFVIKNNLKPVDQLQAAINTSLEESGLKTRISLTEKDGATVMKVENPGTLKTEVSQHQGSALQK